MVCESCLDSDDVLEKAAAMVAITYGSVEVPNLKVEIISPTQDFAKSYIGLSISYVGLGNS